MATVNVQWIGGKRFVGIDSTNHSVVLSTAAEGIGMRPTELLLIALASCTAVDVVEILRKKRLHLEALDISATGEQDKDPPWTYRKIHLHFDLRGPDLNPQAVEQAIHLAEEKYCSVASTLRGVAQITTGYTIHPAPVMAAD